MSSKNRGREFSPSGKNFLLSNMVFIKMKISSLELRKNQDQCLFFRMAPNMKENGTPHLTNVMEEDIKFGPTVAYTKAIGKMIKLMDEEGLFMPTVTSMMDTGKTTKLMVSVNTLTLMELNTKGTGKMISKMEKEKSTGQMVHNTKETISLEKKMASEHSFGLTNPLTTGTS